MNLDAFNPQVIEGGNPKPDYAAAVPHDAPGILEWLAGFDAAINSAPGAVYIARKVWRAGYATGHQTRNKLWLEHVIRAHMTQRLRAIKQNSQRCSVSAEHAALLYEQQAGTATMPGARKGGPVLPYRQVIEWYAKSLRPAHTTKTPKGGGFYSLWIKDGVLYSYRQPLARKGVNGYVTMDPRDFSQTTTRQQHYLRRQLGEAGWLIIEKNLDATGDAPVGEP